MTLEILALCDAATVSEGKLNILGAFDSLHTTQLPVAHPQCAIALRLRFARIEEGEHRLKINVVDEDGRSIIRPLEGSMAVKFGTDDESAVANFVINIHQLKFEQAGQYSIDLAVDGRHETSLPLFVKSRAPAAA